MGSSTGMTCKPHRVSARLLSSSLWSSRKIRKVTKRDTQYSQMLEKIEYERVSYEPETRLEDDPLMPMVLTAVITADKRKAASIGAWRVFAITEVTSFVVLVEAYNSRQSQAIALAIEVSGIS